MAKTRIAKLSLNSKSAINNVNKSQQKKANVTKDHNALKQAGNFHPGQINLDRIAKSMEPKKWVL